MNTFSAQWYAVFHDGIAATRTATEVAFIERHLPSIHYPKLLDVCCGPGRHARELAARGYHIIGVDVNEHALNAARRVVSERLRFVRRDMRELRSLGETFDGVLNLWHSFGYFDDATNADVLASIYAILRPGGRVVIDVYNRDHLVQFPAEELVERNGQQVDTRRSWSGNRLHVQLRYRGSAARDELEWRLYAPAELEALAAGVGLKTVLSCAWFTESIPPSPEHALMQFVFERAA